MRIPGRTALQNLAPLLLTLVAAFAIHARDLGRAFFADDYLFLDVVRSRSIVDVLGLPDPIGNFYRPLGRQIYFWVLAHATGESPFAFHLVNLGLFLAAIALLWVLVRSVSGVLAATVAAAFLAVQAAADVPILWASGSQDLLALAGALGSLVAFQRGRPIVAAALYFLAILSKETVVLVPFVAILIARAPNERLLAASRRALPYLVPIVAWGALQVLARTQRSVTWSGTSFDPAAVPATLVNLARTALGLETSSRGFGASFALSWHVALGIALAAAAVVLVRVERRAGSPTKAEPGRRSPRAARTTQEERAATHRRPAPVPAPAAPHDSEAHASIRRRRPSSSWLYVGAAWALAGALPVVAVAPIWSSYYYLFALCGIGMLLGLVLASAPRVVAVVAVAVLGLASQHARSLDEFANASSPWTTLSHVNRRYLERGMDVVARFLKDLRDQHPELPARSTLFFAGIPSFVAWQVGDGPLVRWAYRDSSLCSYFLSDLTLERARRGPMLMFVREGPDGRLRDVTGDPDRMLQNALGAVESERLDAAESFYTLSLERGRGGEKEHYFGALIAAARDDRAAMARRFEAAGLGNGEPVAPLLESARARVAAGDTVGAINAFERAIRARPHDPDPHSQLSDLTLSTVTQRDLGIVEAFAARALAPEAPISWRRWAHAQAFSGRPIEALASIERYFRMRPVAERDDRGAVRLRSILRERLPGGSQSQAILREDAPKR